MTTIILSAMAQEQSGLLQLLNNPQPLHVAGREFVVGDYHGLSVAVGLSRIGKTAAATTATALLERLQPARMLFTGLAGGLAPQVQVGDVVVGTQYLQHDLDASPIFPKYEVPLYGVQRFHADEVLSAIVLRATRAVFTRASGLNDIKNTTQTSTQSTQQSAEHGRGQSAQQGTQQSLQQSHEQGWQQSTRQGRQKGTQHSVEQSVQKSTQQLGGQSNKRDSLQDKARAAQIHSGLIISGDRFVATSSESRALQLALPDALCVEMEGAAVAQVCHDYRCPFAAVRTISDRADDDAHQDFPRFLSEVAGPLAVQLMREVLNELLLQKK
jgi:nucleoside phosphorylase